MSLGFGFSLPAYTGYAASFGAGASLTLDFTSGNQTLDPRITFSRASNATVTNSAGLLVYAPHNLLTYSEQFDDAAWTKVRSTISANLIAAPDGTTTADKLVEDTTATATHTTSQSLSVAAGTVYTFTVFAKAGERSALMLDFLNTGTTTNFAYFNLANGTAPLARNVTATIADVGSGWYRCSISATAGSSITSLMRISLASTAGAGGNSYTGDGVSGVYIWGAQLNVDGLQPYYTTTVNNLLGYTQEFDNAYWTKTRSFVQTNLLTYSEQFDNAAWAKTRATVTANATVAPDGTTTADKLVIDTTASTNHTAGQNYSVTSGVTYTISIYAKAQEFSEINLRFSAQFPAGNTFFNLSNGTRTNAGTVDASTITSVGNGWYRCTFTQTANATGTATVQVFLASGGAITIPTANGTDGVFLWGAQLVQGATPGDYQVTYGTASAVMYTAPDSSVTADKLVEDTQTGSHTVRNTTSITITSGTPLTASVYAKAAEGAYVIVAVGDGGVVNLSRATFNLTDGSISGLVTAPANVSAPLPVITPLGNGWYRCAVTATVTGVTTAQGWVFKGSNANGSLSYTGDGTSGIYIWGAQLSDSASLDPYVYNPLAAPAAAAYYGPRFDYDPVTLAPKGLLIEEQRTNLLLQSEACELSPWVTAAPYSVGADVAISPNGTQNADALIVESGQSSFSTSVTRQVVSKAASAIQYTRSGYFKALGATTAVRLQDIGNLSANNASVIVSLINGSVVTAPSVAGGFTAASVAVSNAGNGWWRVAFTYTTDAHTSLTVRSFPYVGAVALTGDGTSGLLVWGAQLEAGAFPTSYIPTTAAAVTRAADLAPMLGANFSNWYNQSEGAFYAQFTPAASNFGANRNIFMSSDGTTSNFAGLRYVTTGTAPGLGVTDGGATQASISTGPMVGGTTYKMAGTYKVNDFAVSRNGGTVATDTSGTVPIVTRAEIGMLGGVSIGTEHILALAYYPRRLADSELQSITS